MTAVVAESTILMLDSGFPLKHEVSQESDACKFPTAAISQ